MGTDLPTERQGQLSFYTMKDSMVFYRSFYEALKDLPDSDRLAIYDAISSYGLDLKEVELSGIPAVIWKLVKPNIEANIRRYENGKKGASAKQVQSKRKAKGKQKESKQEANKDKDVDVDKDKEKLNFEYFWELYPIKVAKQKCKDKWDKLPLKDQQAILEKLPAYLNYKPFQDYRHPNPETFFNQRRWEDEIKEPPPVKKEVPLVPEYTAADLFQVPRNKFTPYD